MSPDLHCPGEQDDSLIFQTPGEEHAYQTDMFTVQVSAFGDDSVSDHLDVWEVSFTGGQWMRDQKVCHSRRQQVQPNHSCVDYECTVIPLQVER